MNLQSQEQRAAEELQRKVTTSLDGKKAVEIAVLAEVQAILTNCGLQGLIELLVYKGVLNPDDVSAALRRGYQRATDRIDNRAGQIVLPDSVVARAQ